jgi:hypothetical protein
MIAALFVDARGIYSKLEGVELWDERRDARKYAGPWPVVAHPPCARWCRLAGLVEANTGLRRGDDGGCFAAALEAVRRWGGVLEHPAWSDAFAAYGLAAPTPRAGWQHTFDGGAVCHVEQWHYGHRAKKSTWLYAFGAVELPVLEWRTTPDRAGSALVSWSANRTRRGDTRPRISKRAASATPILFRDILLDLAARCGPRVDCVARAAMLCG